MSSDDDMDMVEQEVADLGVADPANVTKYTTAADIANHTLGLIMSRLAPGVSVLELCTAADTYITEATAKIYNKGKVDKGIAFPTCLSINNVVGHFSPLDTDATVLREGDLVKMYDFAISLWAIMS
jgi:methionine aminopeptidase